MPQASSPSARDLLSVCHAVFTTLLITDICWAYGIASVMSGALVLCAITIDILRFQRRQQFRRHRDYRLEFRPRTNETSTKAALAIMVAGIFVLFLVWYYFPILPDSELEPLGRIFQRPYLHYEQLRNADGVLNRAQCAFVLSVIAALLSILFVLLFGLQEATATSIIVSMKREDWFTKSPNWRTFLITSLALIAAIAFLQIGSPISRDGLIERSAPDHNIKTVLFGIASVPFLVAILSMIARVSLLYDLFLLEGGQPSFDTIPTKVERSPGENRWARVSKRAGLQLLFAIPIFVLVAFYSHKTHAVAGLGAVAYSPGHRGVAIEFDEKSPQSADTLALQHCRDKFDQAADCRIEYRFKDVCGAFAAASTGAYGLGSAPTRSAAAQLALNYCKQYGGLDCTVSVSHCLQPQKAPVPSS